MPDLAELTKQVWQAVATDSGGAAVRTAVGDRVVQARNVAPTDLPARPFVAFQQGAVAQTERGTYRAFYRWLIYDDPGAGTFTLDTIAGLLAAVYASAPIQYQTGGVVGLVEATGLTAPAPDVTLGLTVRALSVAVLLADA